jgi:hypothetical protein
VTTPTDRLVQVTFVVGTPVFVNVHVRQLGRFIGDKRFTINRERSNRPRLEQNEDKIRANDRGGAIAEVAFAGALNVYPMLQFEKYFDYNLRLPGGDLIAVSWDEGEGRCIVDRQREEHHRRKRNDPPDLHIVLRGELPSEDADDGRNHALFFAGWATHDEVIACTPEPMRYGPAHVRRDLHPRLQIFCAARGAGWCG